MKHNVTKLGEGNESAEFVLGNYLTELELRHLTSSKASYMNDTQLELLQLPQAVRDDYIIADMGSVSKRAQLDHGQVSHVCDPAHPLTLQI